MKLSIIVPTYKQNPYYLYQCINSIYSQYDFDYNNLEVIVVKDDLEPRSTIDCVKQFPIKVVQVEQNLGCGRARLLGVTKATGDLIYFMDSDDLLFSCYSLHHIMDVVNKNPDKLAWCFNYYHEGVQKIIGHNMVSLYAIVFKRDIFFQYNIQSPIRNRYEDASIIGQYLYCVGFDNIIEDKEFPIYIYRNIPTSITKTQDSYKFYLEADIEGAFLIYTHLRDYKKISKCFYSYTIVRFCREYSWIDGKEELDEESKLKWNLLMDAAKLIWDSLTDSEYQLMEKNFEDSWPGEEIINKYINYRF